MKYSSGYANEMAYVLLCYGLTCASLEVANENIPHDGITKRSIGYKDDKRSTRRLTALNEELLKFIRQHGEMQLVIEPKKQRLFNAIVNYTQHNNPILEYLVCYILYLRFQKHERNRPLHQDFHWLASKDGSLFQVIDILNTVYADREPEMYNLADKIAKEL